VSGELSLDLEGGPSGEGLYWKYEGWIKRNEGRLGFLIGCNGGIFAIRRELYEPLPASTIVEDFVLSMRVLEKGHRVEFEPAAKATEPPAINSKAEMIRKIRIGAGGFQALSLTRSLLHPKFGLRSFAFWGHKVLRWCVPLALFAGLLANIALAWEQPKYLAALALQAGGAIIAGLAYRTRSKPALPRWTRPISYFYLMNFALLCGFFRYVRGTQRVTWERLAPAGGAAVGGSGAAIIEQRPIPVHSVVRSDASPSAYSAIDQQPEVEEVRREPMANRA
jgi:cellulose synthase/poly-beta-1,6-N-acetylglucosamine synthase-like glycosyltransferase